MIESVQGPFPVCPTGLVSSIMAWLPFVWNCLSIYFYYQNLKYVMYDDKSWNRAEIFIHMIYNSLCYYSVFERSLFTSFGTICKFRFHQIRLNLWPEINGHSHKVDFKDREGLQKNRFFLDFGQFEIRSLLNFLL